MCKEAFRELATELVMEALAEAKEKGYTYELLAQKIGGSPHSYRHYAYGETVPALAVFIGILLTTKSRAPLKRLCELVGLKAVEVEESSLPTTVSKAMKEAGEAFATVTAALEDGKVTEEERKACLKEVHEAIEELLKLKNQLEVRK
jgi:hypothetical protein